ncbi:MAG: hypothetical protein HY912_04095 [Desulfomonile tiedjei]|uniref:Uncharacterized protein n=1 Tax=Desulfomonile tiedjei TaxID=2358 RepID=A0A9D6YZB9_9BACT|nr:hypothetical protein [Desulfomonile tiedjei]
MKRRRKTSLLFLFLSAICLSGGCGGKLATTGWATVADITPQGAMLLQYQDGKAAWKVINPDNPRQQTAIASKNLRKPARFVETKKGSTLTFPSGDTINYREIPEKIGR